MAKDSYDYQRARIERIAGELVRDGVVKFDEDSTFIKFRVAHKALGTNLTESSGEWFPIELVDKSDDWVRQLIITLSNGKIT
jgi:hypothetical protein